VTVVLCRWRCSSFVAFCGGATITAVCYASCTRNVFELLSNLAPVSSSFFFFHVPFCVCVCVCVFCSCLKWDLLLERFAVLGIEFLFLLVTISPELSWLLKSGWERENITRSIGRTTGMSRGIFEGVTWRGDKVEDFNNWNVLTTLKFATLIRYVWPNTVICMETSWNNFEWLRYSVK
jgi:hypothetical protein